MQSQSIESVNYHISRRCNYRCRYCFHTPKSSTILSLERAKQGLRLLHEAGMQKLNFAGGEPLLFPKFVGELARFAKDELDLSSISIVTNGSRINPGWFDKYGKYIDILAVSCDSNDPATNAELGRGAEVTGNLKRTAELCQQHGIRFKINTVVTRLNYEEDLRELITAVQPFRWKVFQVLPVKGENTENGLRNVDDLTVSASQFGEFLERHAEISALVPEPNDLMRNSYLILDEEMRFLNCETGSKTPGRSIFEVGVRDAVAQAGFDRDAFVARDGIYDW